MNIRTNTGKTTRPITKLYPLEVTSHAGTETDESSSDSTRESRSSPSQQMITEQSRVRPLRRTATRARRQLSDWATILRAPPEDVVN